LKVVQGTAVL